MKKKNCLRHIIIVRGQVLENNNNLETVMMLIFERLLRKLTVYVHPEIEQ